MSILSYTLNWISCIIEIGDIMRDLFSILTVVFVFFIIVTLFINLLPIFLPILIIFMVMRYYRRSKQNQENYQEYYNRKEYEQPTQSYRTGGNIKDDVIDVEYKETVEK